ncbi:hypothetical protein TorRG33x02_116030 [Trema orientale]|uniref:Uncharacterized protein n=1 Tax=Trema orientale TaxID=63057 RepID=A0A2P5F434_TREOI|nr:hypothetical protein TorRG33x02_116030 [Trema orientale]
MNPIPLRSLMLLIFIPSNGIYPNQVLMTRWKYRLSMNHSTFPTQTIFCHKARDKKLKFDIPPFDGHMHIEDFLDLLKFIDLFFRIYRHR